MEALELHPDWMHMTDLREQGVPSRSRSSSGWRETRSAERRRAASDAVVATLLTCALLLAGRLAWANGGGRVWVPVLAVDAPDVAAPPLVDVQTDPIPRETRANGLAVCVRLCDGFFFPSATRSGGDAACAAQCPDAPTARYTEPTGSDRIEDAVSTRGALYSALPVANRYRTTLDNTCRCHRSLTRHYSASLLNDPTLRKGDVVMTPEGFVVFQGANAHSITSSNFVALSQARALPEDLRAALAAMERAGPSQRQVDADSSPGVSTRQGQVSAPLASAASAK
jgi:hypothetical protein